MINSNSHHRHNRGHMSTDQYDLSCLISDYCHMLEIHCNNNNIFELRMIYLDINDIMDKDSKHCHQQEKCQCIDDISSNIFNINLLSILNILHCYLYHAYSKQNHNNSDDSMQRLRDLIGSINDKITEYNKNGQKSIVSNMNNINLDKIDLSKLNINPNPNINKPPNKPNLYCQSPPALITQNTKTLIANMPQIPVVQSTETVTINAMDNTPNINATTVANTIDTNNSNLIPIPTTDKPRHGSGVSVNSTISNLSNHTNGSISELSANMHEREDTDPDVVPKLIINPINIKKKPSAIEMSEDRVRKLSGQINEDALRGLIDEYDKDQKIAVEDLEDIDHDGHGIIHPSSSDSDLNDESSLNEDDRAEIENFKLKVEDRESLDENERNNQLRKVKERRGSKHNLMRLQDENEWDVDTMTQTVQDMKKQLLHLALTSSNMDQK